MKQAEEKRRKQILPEDIRLPDDAGTPFRPGLNRAERSRKQASGVALSSVLVALTLIFSYVEMLIPFNFGVPGIKLGLSNLVVLVALYVLGPGYAFSINMVRILLSGLLFSGLSAMLYSLAGGLLSFLVMLLLMKSRLFSPVGVSLGGGVFHNVGQLTVAALVTETGKIFLYLPVLTVAGTVTGTLLGFAATLILRRMGRLPEWQAQAGNAQGLPVVTLADTGSAQGHAEDVPAQAEPENGKTM